MRLVKAGLPLCVLIVLIVSSYLNTLHSPPVLDDFHSFVLAKDVHIQNDSVSTILSLSKTQFGLARWIPMVTFGLDFLWGNGSIATFHVTNICIHLLCTLAVILLVFQLLQVSPLRNQERQTVSAYFFAIWVAGLWALNPVQTNAVTYLVQRMASIEGLFFVLATGLFVLGRKRHRATPITWRILLCYVGCGLSSIGAFLSKENSAMLPVMLLITEWWFFTPDLPQLIWRYIRGSRRVVQGMYVLGFLLTGIIFVHVFNDVVQGYSTRYFDLAQRLLTESRIVVWYMSLLILPLPSRLSLEHDVYLSTSILDPITTLLSILFWVGFLLLILRYRRRYPLITFGGIWFILNLLIESTVVPLELVFEHRLYVPSIGFFLSLCASLLLISNYCFAKLPPGEFSKLCWSTVAILCSCLALLTFERNMAWQTPISINSDAAAKAPLDPRAHANLAVSYGRAKQYKDALKQAELAIKLAHPKYEATSVAGGVLVAALVGQGKPEQAIDRGEWVLKKIAPTDDAGGLPALYLNLAEAHLQLDQIKAAYEVAFKGFKYAARINDHDMMQAAGMLTKIAKLARANKVSLDRDGQIGPGEMPMKVWLAKEFMRVGQSGKAQQLLRPVVQRHQHDAVAVNVLDSIEKQKAQSRIQRAKADFMEKYVYHPFPKFNLCMAVSFLIRKAELPSPLTDLGQDVLQYALKLQPKNSDARLLMGWYFYGKNKPDQAVQWARAALRSDPDYAKAWLGLAFFLAKAGQTQAAIGAFQKTLVLYPQYPKRNVVLGLISGMEEAIPPNAKSIL